VKICIVGGAGFIGTRLADLLISDHPLRIVDLVPSRKYPELSEIADVRDADRMEEVLAGQDVIVLLAAEHRDDLTPSSLYYDVNVQGTRNVIGAMLRHGIRHHVFTSTVAVYGLNRAEPSEEDPSDPFGHYGKSKLEAEELLREWQREEASRRLTIVRPTVVFGERNRGNVYTLLAQIRSGKFVMVGRGDNRKSMAYVGNLASFLRQCIEQPPPGYSLFNYADKPDFRMNDLVGLVRSEMGHMRPPARIPYWLGILGGLGFDLLARLTGRRFPISAIRIRKFCAMTGCSAARVAATGFVPETSLDVAIRGTLAAEFPEDPKPGAES
jgi:nucleoside-diphosphate-sugar epimerase